MNQNDGSNQSAGAGGEDPYSGVEGFDPPDRPDEQGHPLADNNFDVDAFVDVLKLTFERLKESQVLVALVGLSAISLVWSLFAGGAQMIGHILMSDAGAGVAGMVFGLLGILLLPVMLLVAVAQYALYRPGARLLFGEQLEVESPVELVKSTTGLLVPVGLAMLGYSLATGLGTVMCVVPGIVAAFLLCQAPYLVAVRDMEVVDAFKQSYERALEHWHMLLMGFAVMLVASAGVSVIMGCTNSVTGFLGPLDYLATPVLQWLGGTLMLVAGFIVQLAVFGTIDELEGLDTIEGGVGA